MTARPLREERPCSFYRGEIIFKKKKQIIYIIVTAYATIGNGEIIVRDNPSQSLDGLNRNQNKATSENQSVTNMNYKAAFSYVDEVIGMQGIPYALKDANEMWEDPKGFWGNQWIEVKKSFNGLTDSFAQLWGSLSGKKKQPEQPNLTPPVDNNPQP